jgi:hypothetical protein
MCPGKALPLGESTLEDPQGNGISGESEEISLTVQVPCFMFYGTR